MAATRQPSVTAPADPAPPQAHSLGHAAPASRAPSASSAPSGSPAARRAGDEPRELVTRPEPGLARGVWEAPTWAFWAALALILALGALYLARELGWLRRRATSGTNTKSRPST